MIKLKTVYTMVGYVLLSVSLANCGTTVDKPEKPIEPVKKDMDEVAKKAEQAASKPEPKPEEPVASATPLPDTPKSEPSLLEVPDETTEQDATQLDTTQPGIAKPDQVEKAKQPEPIAADATEKVTPAKPLMDMKKKGPNHFFITLTDKKPGHPSYGKGHKKGLLLDNEMGKPVVLRRGETYEFEVKTDPLHDVYFSTTPQGWGGGPVVDGIKGQFTYKGIISVTPNESTPNIIYYSCRNHNSMGWKLHVVNSDASAGETKKILADAASELKTIRKGQKGIVGKKKSDAKARQKLALAGMMISSSGVKRVMASNNEEAKTMVTYAKNKIDEGKKELDAGKIDDAQARASEALGLISTAQRLVPTEEELKEQEAQYGGMLITVEQFEISHKEQYDDTVKRRGKKAAVQYDKNKVDGLVKEAKALAAKKQFVKANDNLQQAEQLITGSIQQMMDKQEVVYELNLDSPEAEFKYELKRYKGYAELIPVAIEEKNPSAGIRKLMEMYVKKGEEQKAAAQNKAKEGDFPTAIAMILSATKQVRLALKSAGVSQ